MSDIYVFSGPCGCGKSTLAKAYAAHLVQYGERNQAYVIHGDDFHNGFVAAERVNEPDCPEFQYWPDILKFNWECILSVAGKALERGLDVIIDYVVEDELPLLQQLAARHKARLFYTVLTATQEELKQRLIQRGSSDLIDRSLFLKNKLEQLPDNQPYLYDISGKTVQQEVDGFVPKRYERTASSDGRSETE